MNDSQTIAHYQKAIDDMLQQYEKPYWDPLSQLARLAEEVGEVSRILNHRYGDKPKKKNEEHDLLEDELGDVVYTILCMANSMDADLEAGLKRSIAKLETRDVGRFKKKSDS